MSNKLLWKAAQVSELQVLVSSMREEASEKDVRLDLVESQILCGRAEAVQHRSEEGSRVGASVGSGEVATGAFGSSEAGGVSSTPQLKALCGQTSSPH